MRAVFPYSFLVVFIFDICTFPVFAAEAATGDGSSLLLILFLGFFALIVVFQLIPAVLLFGGMIRGLLSQEKKRKKMT